MSFSYVFSILNTNNTNKRITRIKIFFNHKGHKGHKDLEKNFNLSLLCALLGALWFNNNSFVVFENSCDSCSLLTMLNGYFFSKMLHSLSQSFS